MKLLPVKKMEKYQREKESVRNEKLNLQIFGLFVSHIPFDRQNKGV